MTFHISGIPDDMYGWAGLALACSIDDPFLQRHTSEEMMSALLTVAAEAGTLWFDDE